MTMSDGATIALDWEVPHPKYDSSVHVRLGDSQVKANVLYGPINLPPWSLLCMGSIMIRDVGI